MDSTIGGGSIYLVSSSSRLTPRVAPPPSPLVSRRRRWFSHLEARRKPCEALSMLPFLQFLPIWVIGSRGRWCDFGLWKYSRHPNYFGEKRWHNTVILLVTPPPIDEAALLRDPYVENESGKPEMTNEAAGEYAKACTVVARECGILVIDIWTKMQEFPNWEETYLRKSQLIILEICQDLCFSKGALQHC